MLRWFGYFKEAVPESPHENHRVRRVVVCHYLSDDTTEVQEPRVVNSGLWQVGDTSLTLFALGSCAKVAGL